MADTLSFEDLQLSTHISRRRVVAGTVTLAVAGATSPAFAQSTDRSPNMPDNIRFSNPDTMQKPPGYSHVVEVAGPGRTVYFAGQLGIDKSGKMGVNAREQMEIAFVSNRSPKRGDFKAEKALQLVHFGGSTAIASTSNNAPGRASWGTPIVVLAGGAAVFTYLSRTSR